MNRQGIERRKGGDDVGAQKLFQQAYDLFHSPRSAAQLGLAEQALGRWEDAEQHVSEALRATNDPWIEKNRHTLGESLNLIRQHVARLEINGSPPGAEVLVNGRLVGRLPLAGAIAVSAGDVDILCRAEGHRMVARKVTLIAAQYERIFIRLEELGSTAAADAPAPSKVPDSTAGSPSAMAQRDGTTLESAGEAGTTSSGVRTAIKWTSLGVAGVGLAAGVVASVARSNAVNDFVAADGGSCRDRNGVAVDQSGQPAAACQGPLDTINTAKTFQWVGFLTAAVLGATWLGMQLSEPGSRSVTGSRAALTSRSLVGGSRTGDPATRGLSQWNCLPDFGARSKTVRCELRF